MLGILFLFLLNSCSSFLVYGGNRIADFFDCFKVSVGYGLGLTLDVKATDWFAPGLGYMSYSRVFGWDSRDLYGVWDEWVVINTPRGVFEANFGQDDYSKSIYEGGDEQRVVRVALASIFLANERWTRDSSTQSAQIELYSLFNFSGIPEYIRLLDPRERFLRKGEVAEIRNKTFWEKGFVEVGATFVFVHCRFGLNLFELVDFLVGIGGGDLAQDDG